MQKDYYEILEITTSATGDEIKKSYRRLAFKYHPDKNPGNQEAEERFKEAAEAYGVLSHPQKKVQYDQFGHSGLGGFGQGQGFQDVGDIFKTFGSVFGDLFGNGGGGGRSSYSGSERRGEGPRQGSDLQYRMEITLKEVINGIKKQIEFKCGQDCDDCKGKGAVKGTSSETCSQCRGSGQVVRQQGFFSMAAPCSSCRGKGRIIKNPCRSCRGEGRKPVDRVLEVDIPKGVSTGVQLRLSGEGESGIRGGKPGDLYVEVFIEPQKDFEVQGQHLISDLNISYVQALLGAEVNFKSIDGNVKVPISRGAQPGDLIKCSGRGLPHLRSSQRGDLVLQIHIKINKKLSKKEEKLVREIADITGDIVNPEKSGFF